VSCCGFFGPCWLRSAFFLFGFLLPHKNPCGSEGEGVAPNKEEARGGKGGKRKKKETGHQRDDRHRGGREKTANNPTNSNSGAWMNFVGDGLSCLIVGCLSLLGTIRASFLHCVVCSRDIPPIIQIAQPANIGNKKVEEGKKTSGLGFGDQAKIISPSLFFEKGGQRISSAITGLTRVQCLVVPNADLRLI